MSHWACRFFVFFGTSLRHDIELKLCWQVGNRPQGDSDKSKIMDEVNNWLKASSSATSTVVSASHLTSRLKAIRDHVEADVRVEQNGQHQQQLAETQIERQELGEGLPQKELTPECVQVEEEGTFAERIFSKRFWR